MVMLWWFPCKGWNVLQFCSHCLPT